MEQSEPKWTDETSYSRGETDRTPRTWELRLPDLTITVTRHIHYPGTWVLRCIFFDLRDLRTDDVNEAKRAALRLVSDRLTKIASCARNAREWQDKVSL